tara:strand:+ start:11694 stop:12797 length:1104 start_codon:yes stop_codon:yes gene_type:complete
MLGAALAAITRALTFPFRSIRATSFYNDVLYAAIRCMLGRITIAQSRYLNPSTSARYVAYCERHAATPKTDYIHVKHGDRVAAHWLGKHDAENVILYLHGGGYTQSISDGYFKYLARLVKDLNTGTGGERQSVAVVVVLAYDLAPEATHPTQLSQAAAVVDHLIFSTGRSPSNIFVSGDSAGGNLALALLSHILHPHPHVDAVKLDKPLGGMLLYSPWAGFSTEFASFDNDKLDVMSPLALRKWSAMFLGKANSIDQEADPGPVSGDAYTEACKNDASWWRGVDHVVNHVFVAYGGDEVLKGCIVEFEKRFKAGLAESHGDASRVIFFEGKREAHVQPIIDIMTLGSAVKSSTQIAIEEWYKARLQS